MVEFIKGLQTDLGFIAEGSQITVTLSNGEIIEGVLYKPAKKEFRIVMSDLVRVIEIEEVEDVVERSEE